jgi:hypothetical protein
MQRKNIQTAVGFIASSQGVFERSGHPGSHAENARLMRGGDPKKSHPASAPLMIATA